MELWREVCVGMSMGGAGRLVVVYGNQEISNIEVSEGLSFDFFESKLPFVKNGNVFLHPFFPGCQNNMTKNK